MIKNGFFDENLLLYGASAKKIYAAVKDLPVIDYHCHLDERKIAENAGFSDVGALWLSGDHYKWRAMRLCGVDETYITGDAPYRDKFVKYAEILPRLIGNPLYYWTHLELKQIFGISEPLNGASAERIYRAANEKLQTITVGSLLKQYNVRFVATTDDPTSELSAHGVYGQTTVSPTFRPDKLYCPTDDYLRQLGRCAGVEIAALDDLLTAIGKRLDFFRTKGCRISDHGIEHFPRAYASKEEAAALFLRRKNWTAEEKEAFFGFLLVWLTGEYAARGMVMQLHFSALRNNNADMFARLGPDTGYDCALDENAVRGLTRFLDRTPDAKRPYTVIYTLYDGNLAALASAIGAFRNVVMGAAWWFNDTVEGIRKNLSVLAEYTVLGQSLGMLTDSRSFASYARFDFFRRILSEYIGGLVDKGEYDAASAVELAQNICYNNVKGVLAL